MGKQLKKIILVLFWAITCLKYDVQAIEYKELNAKIDVPLNKEWIIAFNYSLNENTVNKNNIFIKDENDNNVDININYKSGDKILKIIPQKNYVPQSNYNIFIKDIKSEDNTNLSLPTRMEFTTEKVEEANKQFSVKNIQIGDSEDKVFKILGQPSRKDLNKYGFQWYIYNEDYKNYVQIGISTGKVVGIYTNCDIISNNKGIKIGTDKEIVEKIYGEPLESIRKGYTIYSIQSTEYSTYLIDDYYATIFYDKYNDNTVTSVQLIDKSIELSMKGYYGQSSAELRKSFEREIFDMANVVRVRNNKTPYKWSDDMADVARNHSKDMADNNYFSHTNLDRKSPFDRMKDAGINYKMAAENIACGQTSAIFAHEGWMNSSGHRKNILGDCKELGVGVHFGGSYYIYYTQNFYTRY